MPRGYHVAEPRRVRYDRHMRSAILFSMLCALMSCNPRDCPPPVMCSESVDVANAACAAAFGPGLEAHIDTGCGDCRQLRDVNPWQATCDGEPVDVLCCESGSGVNE